LGDHEKRILRLGGIGAKQNRRKERRMPKEKHKAKQMREFQARLEIENNITFLKSLKFELKHAKREARLQRLIHKRKGYRSFEI